ncbi:crossover junction endodeoxyribonuclease RuvC [Arthrobacter sp. UYEF3]|uniref:crossover junction endodeoxyribonuclease RuvC n=1 Tax=Arthrobacter sp. UYEF3 TaxID=1756365 RepID=UPI0033963D7A
MNVLGIQCEKNRIIWAVASGSTRASANLLGAGSSGPPSDVRSEQLLWVYKEISEMIATHAPDVIHLSEAEAGQSMKASTLERAQVDGIVLAAAAQSRTPIHTFKWATLRARFKVGAKEQMLAYVAELAVAGGIPKSRLTPVVAAIATMDA